MKIDPRKYASRFSAKKFWDTTRKKAVAIGIQPLYSAMLLFFAYQRKDTPHWAKNIILGSLGYLLTPIDLLPDLTPVLGYTDDLGVMSFGLVTIACYINNEVRDNARTLVGKWFGSIDEEVFVAVDQRL